MYYKYYKYRESFQSTPWKFPKQTVESFQYKPWKFPKQTRQTVKV